MTAFISVIALLTAIVIMATKIVELKSAIRKHKAETKTPAATTTTSPASKPASHLPLFIGFDIFMWLLSGFFIVWLAYFSKTPLTKETVMGIGLSCGAWFFWIHQALRDFDRYLDWKYSA